MTNWSEKSAARIARDHFTRAGGGGGSGGRGRRVQGEGWRVEGGGWRVEGGRKRQTHTVSGTAEHERRDFGWGGKTIVACRGDDTPNAFSCLTSHSAGKASGVFMVRDAAERPPVAFGPPFLPAVSGSGAQAITAAPWIGMYSRLL